LEIGIGGNDRQVGGQSLNAWQCYFPFARIAACDIEPKHELNAWRTRIHRLDQSSRSDLDRLCREDGPFDVIIDDGSHLNRHQIFTFEVLFPTLKQGGVYVVEDVQTSYWSKDRWDGAHVTDPAFESTCMGYFLSLAKYLNHQEFMTTDDVDPKRLSLARSIRQIVFEHNLIIVLKQPS
ncbi:MAG: class I SAM-dependent methyltransferase, partial [Alphaproteobacteria bacterium]